MTINELSDTCYVVILICWYTEVSESYIKASENFQKIINENIFQCWRWARERPVRFGQSYSKDAVNVKNNALFYHFSSRNNALFLRVRRENNALFLLYAVIFYSILIYR